MKIKRCLISVFLIVAGVFTLAPVPVGTQRVPIYTDGANVVAPTNIAFSNQVVMVPAPTVSNHLVRYMDLTNAIATNSAGGQVFTNRSNFYLPVSTNTFNGITLFSNSLFRAVINLGGNRATNGADATGPLDLVTFQQLQTATNNAVAASVNTNSPTALLSITNLQNQAAASGSVKFATNLNSRSWAFFPFLSGTPTTIGVTNNGSNIVFTVAASSGSGAAALTNSENFFLAPYTNTFNGPAFFSNLFVVGSAVFTNTYVNGSGTTPSNAVNYAQLTGQGYVTITVTNGLSSTTYVDGATNGAAFLARNQTFTLENNFTSNLFLKVTGHAYSPSNVVNYADVTNLGSIYLVVSGTNGLVNSVFAAATYLPIVATNGLENSVHAAATYAAFASNQTFSGVNLFTGVSTNTSTVVNSNMVVLGTTWGFSNQYLSIAGHAFTPSNVVNYADVTNFALTQGYVTITVTNGLASTGYVGGATNGAAFVARDQTFTGVNRFDGITTNNGFIYASNLFVRQSAILTNSYANGSGTTPSNIVNYGQMTGQGYVTITVTNGLASTTYVDTATNNGVAACVNTNSQTALNSITNLEKGLGAAGSVNYATNLNARSWAFIPLVGSANIGVTNNGTNIVFTSGAGGSSPFSESFSSTNCAITAAGLLTNAHGMSGVPTLFQCRLVCITDEDGWVAGNEFIINPQLVNGASDRGQVVYCDATNIYVRYGANAATYEATQKANGTTVSLVNGNWNFAIRAWR